MENRSSRWLRVIAVMLSARFWTRSRSICVFPLTSFGQWCNFYYLIRQVRTAITFRLTSWHDEKTEQKNPVEKNKWLWFVRVSLKFNWRAKYETVLNLRNCEIPRTGTGEALSKARFMQNTMRYTWTNRQSFSADANRRFLGHRAPRSIHGYKI